VQLLDVTLLTAIGTLVTQRANPTETTMEGIVELLNYAALHSDAKLQFNASNMVLWILDSDASNLSAESKSRSTCVVYHFLSDKPLDPSKPPQPNDAKPMHNAPRLLCTLVCAI
jgi:hypothetical protein